MRSLTFTLGAVVATCAIVMSAPVLAQTSAPPSSNDSQAPSQDSLDTLLAPIALYPDPLVLQIMQCATSPYQIKQVNDWLKANSNLKGSALQDAAAKQGFDPNFIAMVLFPEVLQMMVDKPDWTQQLGQAFNTNKDDVFAAVQKLRKEAENMGNLKSTSQQTVTTQADASGQQVIVIQPANPQVVYVPQYNPQVVYTQQAPPPSDDDNSGNTLAAGLIGFAAGVIVGAAADNDDDHYYYAYGGWGYHGPMLCSSGWNSFYNHRQNMANDYYNHRQNMAQIRGGNVSDRQDARTDRVSDRQGDRSQNISSRQDARAGNASTRQQDRSANASARQSNRADQLSGGAQTRNMSQFRGSGGRAEGVSNRGDLGGARAGQRDLGSSRGGAFSGYQRGGATRNYSSRGRSSMSRGGGGFSRGGRGGRR